MSADPHRLAELVMMVPNPPPGGSHEVQKNLTFHGAWAEYDIEDGTVATSHRFLMWNEPGKQDMGSNIADNVGYFLTSTGLTEDEFWQIANSLTPIPLAKNEQVATLPQSSFDAKGFLAETKDGFSIEWDSKTYTFTKGSIKKIVLENGQPGSFADLKKGMIAVLGKAYILPGQSPTAVTFKIEADELRLYNRR